jgi:hypothetical protein
MTGEQLENVQRGPRIETHRQAAELFRRDRRSIRLIPLRGERSVPREALARLLADGTLSVARCRALAWHQDARRTASRQTIPVVAFWPRIGLLHHSPGKSPCFADGGSHFYVFMYGLMLARAACSTIPMIERECTAKALRATSEKASPAPQAGPWFARSADCSQASWWLPLDGSRSSLWVAPYHLPWLALRLPESIAPSSATRPRTLVTALFQDSYAPTTVLLWAMNLRNLLSNFLILLWTPAILHGAGATPSHAIFAISIYGLGMA